MKKLLFLVFPVIACTTSAQPTIKIYAYSQETSPGMIPKDVPDENGNPVVRKKQQNINYYIFAAYSPSVKVNFLEVWINGKYYKVQSERVDSTPVVLINYNIPDNPVKEVLVPATGLCVMSLAPIGEAGTKTIPSSWFRKTISQSALIVSYQYKGKKYYMSVKKIKPLLPVAGV